jgi:octaprenyl-diphosphate synthase
MTSQQAQTSKTEDTSTPLERLFNLLQDDMIAVNAQIMTHMQSDVALIPQIAQYLIAAGGKRIRPLLTLSAAQLYGCDNKRPHGLAAAVEFIHTATLLHDDVVDESDKRRGKETANIVFGNQASVLVGDFLFSRAFELMVADGSIDILRILSNASAVIAEGEVLQLTTQSEINTSFEEYEKVIASKTAALFSAACEIGPLLAGKGKEEAALMYDYGLNLGLAFQVIDDILDYNASTSQMGKTAGDDFREGKMTLPVILALQSATQLQKNFIARTIGDRDQNDSDYAEMLTILAETKAIEQSIKIAEQYAQRAKDSLGKAPDHALKPILSEIIDFTLNRAY